MIAARLRSISACVMLAYVITHLLNHALALVSLQTADALLELLSTVWRSWPATVLFGTAFVMHFSLAIHAIARRRTFRMSRWEGTQLLLGAAIVPLVATHVVSTRVAWEMYDVHTNHFWVLWSIAVDPWQLARQFGLVLAVWLHACIGIHFWWRIRPWYPTVVPALYAFALLLPALALAGAGVGLGHVLAILEEPQRMRAEVAAVRPPSAAEVADLYLLSDLLKALAATLLALAFLGRWLRNAWLRRRGGLHLAYPEGGRFHICGGVSVLEASRICGIAHASVCGGRGRCSTCRVRVSGADAHRLPPPSTEERRVLARLGSPPQVRLACQLRPPPGIYRITPLLPPDAQPADAYRGTTLAVGEERVLAVMFIDLRGFTAFAQKRLPYDVVFILNRYFRSVGTAIEESGGRVDKFIGDGVMALFGLDTGPGQAARQALDAARGVAAALDTLNAALPGELDAPLRIGIGLHAGAAIVGELGHGRAMGLTAIGDTVNTASRLEALSKDFAAQLVVSEALLELAGAQVLPGERHEVQVRGRDETIAVRAVAQILATDSATAAGTTASAPGEAS